jgi:saccharopine dehydrogenase-like NADP-dependent oxidoreductase
MTIHWCGTGLSAIPGLKHLLREGREVVVWNRSVEKAKAVLGEVEAEIRAFDLAALTAALQPGDVVVSMLPADRHVPLAEACLEKGAHFVSSSYISPGMAALSDQAAEKGLRFVNEVGLDPGLDHLMAHHLVDLYKHSRAYDAKNELSFLSYCGGVPKQSNAFRYKFSWSPLGVLRALRTPSRSIRNWTELAVSRPWEALTSYVAPLPQPETFEVYPNRDSLPFMGQYHFQGEWRVKNFVRGTIRLMGWAEAWASVFAEIETLSGPEGDARLAALSDELWTKNAYAEGEPDRVVLFVGLKAEREGKLVFEKTWALDAYGDARGSAMARLVSMPVAYAVEAVLAHQIPAGVTAAPSDPALVQNWLKRIENQAQFMALV